MNQARPKNEVWTQDAPDVSDIVTEQATCKSRSLVRDPAAYKDAVAPVS